MEQTLKALESILVKAIPTGILLLLLYFYFKAMLFGPLARVLAERDELTKGARKAADQSLQKAEQKAAEYEAKLKDARNEVYKQQEETRKKWLADQAAQLAAAKASAEASMEAAKAAIEAEAVTARESLSVSGAALAEQITNAVLARRNG
jgi:F-type H+-transporting ATPase subunit b